MGQVRVWNRFRAAGQEGGTHLALVRGGGGDGGKAPGEPEVASHCGRVTAALTANMTKRNYTVK